MLKLFNLYSYVVARKNMYSNFEVLKLGRDRDRSYILNL